MSWRRRRKRVGSARVRDLIFVDLNGEFQWGASKESEEGEEEGEREGELELGARTVDSLILDDVMRRWEVKGKERERDLGKM